MTEQRGALLSWLAVTAQGLALVAACLGPCIAALLPASVGRNPVHYSTYAVFGASIFLSAVGGLLGGAAWFLGRRDLAAMRQGSIDGADERLTHDAVKLARWGTFSNATVFFVIVGLDCLGVKIL